MQQRMVRWLARAALGAAALLGFFPAPGLAAVLQVTKTADINDGSCLPLNCSLRDALGAANSGDSILIPAGTYTLGSPLMITTDVTLQGAGAGDTIIQAAAAPGIAGYNVFDITVSTQVALNDLTIRHGAVIGGAGSGGAIFANGSGTLSITRCNIVFNEVNTDSQTTGGVASGGALFVSSPSLSLLITDSTIADNQATANGGSGNGGAVSGGAIFAGTTTIIRSTVARNQVTANSVMAFAGAVDGGALFTGTTTIVSSTIADNQAIALGGEADGAAAGGAVFCGPLVLRNSTLSGNSIAADAVSGGAIFAGPTQASNSTIVDTHVHFVVASGGGIFAKLTARNTILANNELSNCTSLASDGYNLVDTDQGCSITPAAGDQIGTASMPINPHLGPLADNGGPTLTHALLRTSTAIDGGNPGGCNDETGDPIPFDQRGVPRTLDGNLDGIPVCDIGAYEFRGTGPTAPVLDRVALLVLTAVLLVLGARQLAGARRH